MTGRDLTILRRRLGLTAVAFGLMLGIDGTTRTIDRKLRRYEAYGWRSLPPDIEDKAAAIKASAEANIRWPVPTNRYWNP